MDHLWHLRDSILGYISPSKYRRRSTVLPATPSPTAKSNHLSRPSQSESCFTEPRDANTRAVLNGRVSKKYLSPSDTRRLRQKSKLRKSQSSNSDGTTKPTSPDRTSSRTSHSPGGSKDSAKHSGILESVEVDDETISTEDKVAQFLEHQRAAIEADSEGGENWHEAEHALFNELKMRGLQPLLPAQWRSDFRTVPPTLFSYDADEVFLNSASGNEFRASAALLSLVSLGGRVRSIVAGSRTREEVIEKEIINYIKWAEFDGGYKNKDYIPITTIVASEPGQDIESISDTMTDQFEYLARQHRESLLVEGSNKNEASNAPTLYVRTPPLLYGVVIAGAKVIFITFDAAKDDSKPRTIAYFDFEHDTMDVWNGFAVAIMVISARNYMISIRENLDDYNAESSDPDA